jgi:ComF family protein
MILDLTPFVATVPADGRRLVLSFKHGDHTYASKTYIQWMMRAGGGLMAESDIIVPVPLHWTRLCMRRYNQAALLANFNGRKSGNRIEANVIHRQRRTASQGRKSIDQRQKNLRGAFAIYQRNQKIISAKRVLLIDDVMTTGATVSACARIFRRSGASKINVLTLARVVHDNSTI